MKTDYLNAKILSHRANLQRYATLLATQLTELEREYLHKRIEEERAEVASLELERAAKAARLLDDSKNASAAIDIAKQQEKTKQAAHLEKVKEYEAHKAAYDMQRVEKEGEEKRKTLAAETEQHKKRAQYKVQLDRKRMADQIAAEKYMKEEEMKKQEEKTAREEAMKRKTLEYEV